MTASKPTRSTEEEGSEATNDQRWEYEDDGHALSAPSTRRAAVTGSTATSRTDRLHEDLTVVTEAAARLDEDYEPEVRLGIERRDIEESLTISVELDAAEARALAGALEESAREAEEIVVDERVHAMEAGD